MIIFINILLIFIIMLDKDIVKKINEFVYMQPRTIQEIAQLIKKNWRTADRYVEQIAEEQGTIATKTFRGGTKGALKIVYWCNIERIHSITFQERLYRMIELSRRKEDFSPFDIFQYVDKKRRYAFAYTEGARFRERSIIELLRSCQKQLLSFSGNLSWINIEEKGQKALDALKDLIKHNVSIKIITRIDIASLSNISKLLELEERLGKKCIEIRHCEQPLRGMIVDDKIARFLEEKVPERYKAGELKKKVTIFYEIYDEEWIAWLQKVFFNLFRTAVEYEKRIEDIKTIKALEL